MALRTGRVQSVGDGQRRVDRRVGVHVDRAQRRSVLRHRESDAQGSLVRRRPVRHQIHGGCGRGHMGRGRRVRRPRRQVLVRPPVPRAQRHAVRGLLPVPGPPGARLPQGRGARQVPCLLRRTAHHHLLFLRAHRPVPGAHHQQYTRRTTRKYRPRPIDRGRRSCVKPRLLFFRKR